MNAIKWKREPDGDYAGEDGEYTIKRERYYADRYLFTALHRGKLCGSPRRALSLAKRDAQQHANGYRGNVASTDPDFKANDTWCHCEPS